MSLCTRVGHALFLNSYVRLPGVRETRGLLWLGNPIDCAALSCLAHSNIRTHVRSIFVLQNSRSAKIAAGSGEIGPVALQADGKEVVTEAYREVTVAAEIARELQLAGLLGGEDSTSLMGSSLNEGTLEAAGFKAFASYRTNRIKYRYVAVLFDELFLLLVAP